MARSTTLGKFIERNAGPVPRMLRVQVPHPAPRGRGRRSEARASHARSGECNSRRPLHFRTWPCSSISRAPARHAGGRRGRTDHGYHSRGQGKGPGTPRTRALAGALPAVSTTSRGANKGSTRAGSPGLTGALPVHSTTSGAGQGSRHALQASPDGSVTRRLHHHLRSALPVAGRPSKPAPPGGTPGRCTILARWPSSVGTRPIPVTSPVQLRSAPPLPDAG